MVTDDGVGDMDHQRDMGCRPRVYRCHRLTREVAVAVSGGRYRTAHNLGSVFHVKPHVGAVGAFTMASTVSRETFVSVSVLFVADIGQLASVKKCPPPPENPVAQESRPRCLVALDGPVLA